MKRRILTLSKRLVHESSRQPNGLSTVIRDVRSWALRCGWKHSHIGFSVNNSSTECIPMWTVAEELQADLADYYTHGLISDYLWPMLHGMCPVDREAPDLAALDVVGSRLAQRALAMNMGAQDQVWVHDFQVLSTLPELANAATRPRIGYFQHAPLVIETMTSEVADRFARYLSFADLVAVQTPRDAESAGALGVDYRRILVAPVCTGAREPRSIITTQPNDRLSVLITGRCDPTKGHVQGIKAVSKLVRSMSIPVELVVHAPPSRTGSRGYPILRDAIATTAREARPILNKNGGALHLYDQVCTSRQLRQLLQHANCLLIPSIADGMNLIAKEYVVERGSAPSKIVLTSRTGARYSLPGAFVATDASVPAITETLEKAVLTGLGELEARWQENKAAIATETPSRWMTQLAAALEDVLSVRVATAAAPVSSSMRVVGLSSPAGATARRGDRSTSRRAGTVVHYSLMSAGECTTL